MQVKKQQNWTWNNRLVIKLGNEYVKAVYCNPVYLTSMQSTSCEMLGWMNLKLNQDCWEKYQQPQICRWHYPLLQKVKKNKRASWWRWKRRVKKLAYNSTLKKKTRIMVSGHITSWQIDGETMDIVRDLIFFSSKITEDGNCSHEIKRRLLPRRKAITNLDNILKNRNITLPTKVHIVKAMVFPVIMYECEIWTIKPRRMWILSKCGAGEDSWKSLGQQEDQISQS